MEKASHGYFVKYVDFNYYLYEIDSYKDISFFYQISKDISYADDFILNREGNLLSYFQNHSYVLLKMKDYEGVFDIFSFYSYPFKISLDWRDLWIQKSDYIESYYQSIQGKYLIIDESLPYYLSLLELSIYYLKKYEGYMDYAFAQHKIINIEDYCNPFSFKIDLKERDFGEYLKYLFFSKKYINLDLSELIFQGSLYFYYPLVFARMLYPNYYFDIFEDIVLDKKKSSDMNDVLMYTNDYEIYLKTIYNEMKKYCSMGFIPF